MREPESVMAGIWWRGRWDVVGNRRDKGALEVEIVEDAVVYASESLEFELNISCMEPLKESNFIIVQEGSLKDVSDSLTLLCMRWWVVDVARNGELSVRYVMYVRLFWTSAPQVFPWTKHRFSFAICTHPEGKPSGGMLCENDHGQRLQIAGLPLHRRRNYWVTMSQSPCGFKLLLNGRRPSDTRHNPGLVYSM